MAGSWMSIIKGFGGMKVRDGQLHFDPFLPDQWDSYSFKIGFRDNILEIHVSSDGTDIQNHSETPISIFLSGEEKELPGHVVEEDQESEDEL